MFNYNECTCDKCSKNFDKTSDVVVCPECGTPHHRACWKELGHCVNEEKHSETFSWAFPERANAPTGNICPKCQTANPKDATFCESCGTAMGQKQTSFVPSFTDFKAATTTIMPSPPKALEGEQDGVSFKDMAIYIGTTAPYYIFKFRRKEQEGKNYNPFCWSAFLFGPLYFLYRKMWLTGILCGFVNLLSSIPTSIILSVQLGLIAPSSPLMFAGIQEVSSVLTYVMLAINVIWGFMAIPLYQKAIKNTLRKLKQAFPIEREYYDVLIKKSGPSKAVMLGSLVLTLVYLFY